MSELKFTGSCPYACELDEYQRSETELSLMTDVASVDPFPRADHGRKIEAMSAIATFHSSIVDHCQSLAKTSPCGGPLEEPVVLGGMASSAPIEIRCPLVADFFAGAIE